MYCSGSAGTDCIRALPRDRQMDAGAKHQSMALWRIAGQLLCDDRDLTDILQCGGASHHIVKDIHSESGRHEKALLLPQLALRCDQAGAQDGQEGVEGEVQVLDVVTLVGLEHPLQALS